MLLLDPHTAVRLKKGDAHHRDFRIADRRTLKVPVEPPSENLAL